MIRSVSRHPASGSGVRNCLHNPLRTNTTSYPSIGPPSPIPYPILAISHLPLKRNAKLQMFDKPKMPIQFKKAPFKNLKRSEKHSNIENNI